MSHFPPGFGEMVSGATLNQKKAMLLYISGQISDNAPSQYTESVDFSQYVSQTEQPKMGMLL